MTEEHKKIIRNNFDTLTENIRVNGILGKLLAEGTIGPDEQEKLCHGSPDELLRLVMKREDRGFYVLIDACDKKCMPHLANLLKDAGKNLHLICLLCICNPWAHICTPIHACIILYWRNKYGNMSDLYIEDNKENGENIKATHVGLLHLQDNRNPGRIQLLMQGQNALLMLQERTPQIIDVWCVHYSTKLKGHIS